MSLDENHHSKTENLPAPLGTHQSQNQNTGSSQHVVVSEQQRHLLHLPDEET